VVVSSEEEVLSISDDTDSDNENVVEFIAEGPSRRSDRLRARTANTYNEDPDYSDRAVVSEYKDRQSPSADGDIDMGKLRHNFI
jgi:hypothetical protein